MRLLRMTLCFLALALAASSLPSARAADTSSNKTPPADPMGLVTCSYGAETRTLTMATKGEGGCELHYEKYGKDRVISWSSVSVSPCLNAQVKVRKELENAGWKCVQE